MDNIWLFYDKWLMIVNTTLFQQNWGKTEKIQRDHHKPSHSCINVPESYHPINFFLGVLNPVFGGMLMVKKFLSYPVLNTLSNLTPKTLCSPLSKPNSLFVLVIVFASISGLRCQSFIQDKTFFVKIWMGVLPREISFIMWNSLWQICVWVTVSAFLVDKVLKIGIWTATHDWTILATKIKRKVMLPRCTGSSIIYCHTSQQYCHLE